MLFRILWMLSSYWNKHIPIFLGQSMPCTSLQHVAKIRKLVRNQARLTTAYLIEPEHRFISLYSSAHCSNVPAFSASENFEMKSEVLSSRPSIGNDLKQCGGYEIISSNISWVVFVPYFYKFRIACELKTERGLQARCQLHILAKK